MFNKISKQKINSQASPTRKKGSKHFNKAFSKFIRSCGLKVQYFEKNNRKNKYCEEQKLKLKKKKKSQTVKQ